MINKRRIVSRAMKEMVVYSTLIFIALIFIIELVTENTNYFSFYLAILFLITTTIFSYSVINFKKALTKERALAFSFVMGGVFMLVTFFVPSYMNMFATMELPNLIVGITQPVTYSIILWAVTSVSFLFTLRIRGMI